MKTKTILIAGGGGFLRRYVADSLLGDPENVVVGVDLLTAGRSPDSDRGVRDDARYETHCVDAEHGSRIADVVSECSPHTIINLPMESESEGADSDPRWPMSGNILATFHLLEAARLIWLPEQSQGAMAAGLPRFIQLSTATTADASRSTRPYDEIVASRLVERWTRHYGVPGINVAATNPFGPYQSRCRFVPEIIDALLRQRPRRVHCDRRHWVFAEDIADAVAFLMKHGVPGRRYDVDGAAGGYSALAIAELISDQLDQLTPRESGSYRDFLSPLPAVADTGSRREAGVLAVHADLGWRPLNDFHCALAATVRWYVEHAMWWERSPLINAESVHHAVVG